ncbi:MAG: nucleotidyltransferase [Deltaproteobacteria bacterium]|nr:nucleotidyltransferase [Deltaproteobacteria bacterium]
MELQRKLLRLCRALNHAGVKYVVVGGCAVILHGYFRTTHDIDLLVEPSPENIRQLKKTLSDLLGSEEVFEIRDDDIARYAVVRFAPQPGEVVIDLIGKIGSISFDVAVKDIEEVEVEGTKIPLCGLSTLIATKQGVRPKDKEDLLFLIGKKEYLEKQSRNVR